MNYKKAIKDWYKNSVSKNLYLEYPKTYNEKVQWTKLYDTPPHKNKIER